MLTTKTAMLSSKFLQRRMGDNYSFDMQLHNEMRRARQAGALPPLVPATDSTKFKHSLDRKAVAEAKLKAAYAREKALAMAGARGLHSKGYTQEELRQRLELNTKKKVAPFDAAKVKLPPMQDLTKDNAISREHGDPVKRFRARKERMASMNAPKSEMAEAFAKAREKIEAGHRTPNLTHDVPLEIYPGMNERFEQTINEARQGVRDAQQGDRVAQQAAEAAPSFGTRLKSSFGKFRNTLKGNPKKVALGLGLAGAGALYGGYKYKQGLSKQGGQIKEASFLSSTAPIHTGTGAILGAAAGYIDAKNMSESDKKYLREQYHLSPESSITLRAMGRGATYGAAGGLIGAGLARNIKGLDMEHAGYFSGGAAGALGAAKYSTYAANKLRKRNRLRNRE